MVNGGEFVIGHVGGVRWMLNVSYALLFRGLYKSIMNFATFEYINYR